jgi:magnesium and cobalt transporter
VRLWWVRPARLLVAILRWPVELLLFIGTLLLRPLGVLGAAHSTAQTEGEVTEQGEHEIRELVENAQASGVIEAGNRELIESIFTFGDTRAHEVMTPRPDMVALPIECSAAQLLDCLQESGHSRIPLYEENIDRVVGIVHARDVLARLGAGEVDFSPRDLMRQPLFMPETQKIDEALAAMRAGHTHLSIVVYEYGGTAGLLTVEDILEELVGDIADEHDRKVEEPFVLLDDNSALVDARLHTEDLIDHWRLDLPTGEFDTVGGFVIEHLGRAPVAGDKIEVSLEEETVTLSVHSVRGQRPQRILITRSPRQAKDDERTKAEE